MKKVISFLKKYYVQTFFLVLLIIGLCTFRDYGTYDDEFLQRNHSLVSYYKVKGTIENKDDKICNSGFNKNSNIEMAIKKENIEKCLKKYPYKYYGVAMQLPLVAIEDIFNFKLSYQTIFYIRHLWTFLIFFVSLICLYKIIDEYIIKDKKCAFFAVLFLVLSPRIYGEAFYNIKDLVFMSLSIINLYFIFKYLRERNLKTLIILCFISALVINSRIVGGIYIGLAFLYNILCQRKNLKECIKSSIHMVLFTYLFYILVTPASWSNPIMFPFKTIDFFYNYIDPVSKLEIYCLHLGKFYSAANLPSNYIPVWIFITTPLLYIVLFVIGFFVWMVDGFKKIVNKKTKDINKELVFCNIILVFMLLFVVLKRPTLYGGWRHLYFLYPLIIIDCIVGLKKLLSIKFIKISVVIILCSNTLFLIFWMVRNHPYQYEYYEYPFREKIVKNFAMNYYQTANIDAVKYILKHDKRKKIKLIILNNMNDSCIKLAKDYKRIKIVGNIKEADYVISNYVSGGDELFAGHKTVYYKEIDGKYRLFTVYK